MGKFKELMLDHRGYTVKGVVKVELWDGEIGYLTVLPMFIPANKLSAGAIKNAINDGQFGCKSILEAKITIFDTYGDQAYNVKNRVMTLNSKQCFYGTRGIKRDTPVY
jgi:hypothetical protein